MLSVLLLSSPCFSRLLCTRSLILCLLWALTKGSTVYRWCCGPHGLRWTPVKNKLWTALRKMEAAKDSEKRSRPGLAYFFQSEGPGRKHCMWAEPAVRSVTSTVVIWKPANQVLVAIFQLKPYLWTLTFEFHIIFMCHEIWFLETLPPPPFKNLKAILS